ncbi:MAG: class I SAM-dependent methyltransferase [Campylobacterales bacterium]|nr:class I SAM-dependent methyltransferase [Campylobacterales bacterium]
MSHFDTKAKDWDKGNTRVNGAQVIADAIAKRHNFHKEMEIIDFGVGTGLLGFAIAPEVKKVYGVDTSKKMLEQVEEKNSESLSIEPIFQDIIKTPLTQTFDALISSMTLHHIENLELFFSTIYKNIKEDGFIAIADLELEDGTFHSDNTGVYHFGFAQENLVEVAQKCGFKNVCFENINTINKPHRDFGVFLLTATK